MPFYDKGLKEVVELDCRLRRLNLLNKVIIKRDIINKKTTVLFVKVSDLFYKYPVSPA